MTGPSALAVYRGLLGHFPGRECGVRLGFLELFAFGFGKREISPRAAFVSALSLRCRLGWRPCRRWACSFRCCSHSPALACGLGRRIGSEARPSPLISLFLFRLLPLSLFLFFSSSFSSHFFFFLRFASFSFIVLTVRMRQGFGFLNVLSTNLRLSHALTYSKCTALCAQHCASTWEEAHAEWAPSCVGSRFVKRAMHPCLLSG